MSKPVEYVVFATDRRDIAHTVEAIGVDRKFRLYRMQVES